MNKKIEEIKNGISEGSSDEVIAENIKKMVDAGVPQDQAVAVAYKKAGREKKNSDEKKDVPLSRIFYKGSDETRIPVSELIDAWQSEKDSEYPEEDWGDDDPLELEDGTTVSMKELADAFNRKNKKGDDVKNSEGEKPEDKEKKEDEVKNGKGCLKNGEPEAAEHTALIAEALALLEDGKIDEAKSKLGSVAKKEAAEIKNGENKEDAGKEEKPKDKEPDKESDKKDDKEKPALKTDKIANSDLAAARRSASAEDHVEDLRTKKYETGFGAAQRLGY